MSCPNAKVTPIYTSEVDGVNMLLKNKVMLTITARKFTQKEYDYLKGTDQLPEAVPVAYDGMALICNNKNLDSCITVNDVKRILSGKVTKWSDVNKGSKLGDIWVCFDNKKSSAVSFCVDSILGGKTIDNPNIFAAKTQKMSSNMWHARPTQLASSVAIGSTTSAILPTQHGIKASR